MKTDLQSRRARVHAVLLATWLEHRLLLLLCGGYVGLGAVLLAILGRPWPIRLTTGPFVALWLLFSVLVLLVKWLRHPRRLQEALTPRGLTGAVVVGVIAVPTQITFQALKQSIGPVVGFRWDIALHRVDVALHGQMAWLWLMWLVDTPSLLRGLDALYLAWFVALFAFVAWASWSSDRVLRMRALVAFLFLWILGGTIGAALGASAGPCYYGDVVAGANPYAALVSQLDTSQAANGTLFARKNERALWVLYAEDRWGAFGGVSAMPSLHVAVAVLFALIAWQRSRLVGAVLWVYALAIQAGSIALAWHYAVDGYAGASIAVICWVLAGRANRARALNQTAVIEPDIPVRLGHIGNHR